MLSGCSNAPVADIRTFPDLCDFVTTLRFLRKVRENGCQMGPGSRIEHFWKWYILKVAPSVGRAFTDVFEPSRSVLSENLDFHLFLQCVFGRGIQVLI